MAGVLREYKCDRIFLKFDKCANLFIYYFYIEVYAKDKYTAHCAVNVLTLKCEKD